MTVGNLFVEPILAPAPGTKGEARGWRVSGSGRYPRRRTKEWLKLRKGGRGGEQPARSGRIAVATYNIWDGRAAGLLSAARAFDHANVDLAIIQEVKLKDPKFAPRTEF